MSKLKKIIIFSLMITLPISIYYGYWLNNTLQLYFQYDQLSIWITKGSRLYTAGLVEYKDLKHIIKSNVGINTKSDINLFTEKKYLNELMSSLPESSFKDKKGFLYVNNEFFKGKVRLRGDHFYHWLFPQKSWRFKASKKNLVGGVHKLNFIIPKGNEILNNHLSYKLAKKLDLLAPDSAIATLSVNNHLNGIKLLTEQIDESFLRKNKRMPNDIYKGDNIGAKKVQGVFVNLFDSPSLWDKPAYNNHYPRESRKPLEELLLLNNDALIDVDSFAAFSSFIDLINTYHYDNSHNWILYYDHYYEKMYPIIWDPVGWYVDWEKKNDINIITSDFLQGIYRNYQFLYKKYEVMQRFFRDKAEFVKLIDREIETAKEKISANGFTSKMNRIVILDDEDAIEQLDIFKARVLARFALLEDYFLGDIEQQNYHYAIQDNKMSLSVAGHKMIEKIIIKAPDIDQLQDVEISYTVDGKKITQSLKNNLSLNSGLLEINRKLLANAQISHTLNFQEATYDFDFIGLDVNAIESVALQFLNLKQQVVSIDKKLHIEQKEFIGVHTIVASQSKRTTEVWENTRYFSGFNLISNDIIIKPGTRLIFAENATVKAMGKVTAIGTKESPIVFQAKDKAKPWNAFVLKDEQANDSVFKHCIFQDGSGDKGVLYEYTAMFSVHNVKNLLVENCQFLDSRKTDDMIHVIYSDVHFKNSQFVRSLSDALDADISNLVVENCEFIDSGNDAIDLMTSNAVVTNTKFINSSDKGISIGEGSNLLAINNLIKGNVIGMQSKDTSKAYIYNTTFVQNTKAVDAYHKNWRYSKGGMIHLDNCKLERNIENATVGKKSRVLINRSQIDTVDNFEQKSLQKKKILISQEAIKPFALHGPLFENKELLIRKDVIGYHE